MNNKISLVAILMAVICVMTSCLGASDSTSSEYDDVAVTAFTLGTLKKVVYTKNNGKDSTYTTTASCSSVRFTIDNVNNKIYNVDSLARGIVTSKALVTVTTKNYGTAYLLNATGDTVTYISSSDSLDFSKPRKMRVVAADGSWYKDYDVDVRVHQEPRDSVYWTRLTNSSELSQLNKLHAVCFAGKMIVYGTDANSTFRAYISSITDGKSWTEMTVPFTSEASMVTNGTTLFACSNGKVYSSQDNATWTEMGTNNDINVIAAATQSALYAVATDGRMLVSANGGATWADDAMADSKSLMPVSDISAIVTTTSTNSDINTISIFGNTEKSDNGQAVVWSKIVDNSNSSYTEPWQYQKHSTTATKNMPALTNVSVIPYAEGFIMMGGNGRGTCTNSAFDKFYLSEDHGLTWWNDSRFYFPLYFASDTSNFAFVVDSSKYMWLICGTSGQVWRGRLTQMTW